MKSYVSKYNFSVYLTLNYSNCPLFNTYNNTQFISIVYFALHNCKPPCVCFLSQLSVSMRRKKKEERVFRSPCFNLLSSFFDRRLFSCFLFFIAILSVDFSGFGANMLRFGLNSIIFILLLTLPNLNYAQFESPDQAWFCRSSESVEPCGHENSVDKFNNERVYPVLQKLLQKDFFKFYKVRFSCNFNLIIFLRSIWKGRVRYGPMKENVRLESVALSIVTMRFQQHYVIRNLIKWYV